MTHRNRRDAGFTLIEILAALVVFGFLMAGLSQGVQFGLTAWRLQTATVARDADLDVTDRILSRLLTAIRPANPGGAPSVIGTKAELAFTTNLPVRIGEPPTYQADARLALDGDHLILELVPHLHAIRTGPKPHPDRTVLATGVEEITFAYWRQNDHQWVAAWKAPQLPALIRLTIGLHNDRHWAPIVAAPNLSHFDQ
jgi:general secretion pathway protein J